MRFIAFSIAAYAAAQEAAGHSWMTSAGGGEIRGGLTKSDSHNQRFWCPTASLADCQPDHNQKLVLGAADQRPCRAGRSPTLGSGAAGQPILIKWAGNGHANEQSDGTCVSIRLAPFKEDPDNSDFRMLEQCLPYHVGDKTSAMVQLPSDLTDGIYTVQWAWDFASFTYSSCIDIDVKQGGGAQSPSTAPDTPTTEVPVPTTTAAPEAAQTPDVQAVNAANVTGAVSDADLKKYLQQGCASMADPKQFCRNLVKGRSYCKDYNADACGRARCQRDDTHFEPCNRSSLLI
jgi:hypothetical protein